MSQTLVLTLTYALPLAALLWLVSNRSVRTARLVLLVALPLFYIGHYLGLQDLRGWPTTDTPPDRFELLSEFVVQPNRKLGIDGAIHLWVLEPGRTEPRAYRLPYQRRLHQRVAAAGKALKNGKSQIGVRRSGGSGGDAGDGKGGSGQGDIHFEPKPGRRLPPKRRQSS